MVVYAPDEELGEVPHIRTPIRMASGVAVRFTAPKLGQHNAEVLGALGLGPEEIEKLHTEGIL
jgi:crotonobetainyl-CoA:carnitine CoA-transferase CaiB-like acyl-CoA transferase